MSEVKSSGPGNFSSLRDRIAAVDEIHVQLTATTSGWRCRCGAKFVDSVHALREWRLHKADAVIAELGLYREGRESRTVTNEQGATYRIEGGHRYVTDWKADDE